MTHNPGPIAERLKELLVATSPLIESYTSVVCPACKEVCCRQKHGRYRDRDVGYLLALGVGVPLRDRTRDPEGPCEAMGPTGCLQPRWMRPFKCTWYFCDPLLKAFETGPPRQARQFSALMQDMIDLYDRMGISPRGEEEGTFIAAAEQVRDTTEGAGCGVRDAVPK